MSSSPHGLQKSFTAEEVHEWLHTAQRKHLELHVLATQSQQSPEGAVAVTRMSDLVQDAIEEVRVISASLREGSQMVRGESADLRAYSTQLLEQCARSMECMAQFLPDHQEMQETERRMLDMF